MSFLEKVKMPSWLGTLIAVIGIVAGIGFGFGIPGETVVTGTNGNKYKLNYNINEPVINLIDSCNLKEVGESCKVAVQFETTLIEKGTSAPVIVITDTDVEKTDVEPVKVETPDVDVVIELKKIELPKIEPLKPIEEK